MIPMTTVPMVPEVATLLAITPAFFGVLLALVAAVAVAIRGTLRELEGSTGARVVTPRPILHSAAPGLAV